MKRIELILTFQKRYGPLKLGIILMAQTLLNTNHNKHTTGETPCYSNNYLIKKPGLTPI